MKHDNTWKERYETELEGDKVLIIVEGSRNIIFELGNNTCGDATYYGMSVKQQGEAGGVIKLDEVVRLRDFLNKHISLLLPCNK